MFTNSEEMDEGRRERGAGGGAEGRGRRPPGRLAGFHGLRAACIVYCPAPRSTPSAEKPFPICRAQQPHGYQLAL